MTSAVCARFSASVCFSEILTVVRLSVGRVVAFVIEFDVAVRKFRRLSVLLSFRQLLVCYGLGV